MTRLAASALHAALSATLAASGAAAFALATASPAAAQVAGAYAGTATDGSQINVNVNKDPGSAGLIITSFSLQFRAKCSNNSILYSNIGFGSSAKIVDGRASETFASASPTVSFSIKFSDNDKRATGKVYVYAATLDPIGAHPKRALLCYSPTQAFEVHHQAPNGPPPPAAGTMVQSGVLHAPVGPALPDED